MRPMNMQSLSVFKCRCFIAFLYEIMHVIVESIRGFVESRDYKGRESILLDNT